jgi:hypothetical protein
MTIFRCSPPEKTVNDTIAQWNRGKDKEIRQSSNINQGHIHDPASHQSAASSARAANLAPVSWLGPAVTCPGCWRHWQRSQRASLNCCSSPLLCPWIRRWRHDLLGELSAGGGEGFGPLRGSGQAGCLESKLTRTFGPGRDARDILLQR